MSNATRTLRDAVVILRDPYNRNPADVQATADALDRIAGVAEEFDLESLLAAEAEIGATPTDAQTLGRRMILGVLRAMGFGRQETPTTAQPTANSERCPWCWWEGPRELQCQTISQGARCDRHAHRSPTR